MNKLLTISLYLVLVIATDIQAQGVPDFSGTWVLDTSRGENLGMVASIEQTAVISQTPDKLTLDVTSSFMGTKTEQQLNFDLTGNMTINETAMGEVSETVTSWVDDTLVTVWTSEGAIAGSKVVRTEIRSLSADNRTMAVSTARGDRATRVMVFAKQQ